MKWFNRWIYSSIKKVHSEPLQQTALGPKHYDSDGGLNIQVYSAIGGRIVSFSRYDSKIDRHNRNTYIIPDHEDFQKELGKIITLESLR